MTYFLNKDILNAIAIVHSGDSSFFRSNNKDIIKHYDSNIFRDLLVKQPELKNEYELFKSKIKINTLNNVVFSEIFADKIEINNFSESLINTHFAYVEKNKDARANTFKYIYSQYPEFLKLIHDSIKNNKVSRTDITLYDHYFQFLRNKTSKSIDISKEEVLENIDTFYTNNEIGYIKKKINAYIHNFPKDENLYNHILKSMGEEIKNFGLAKLFFEEKLKLFPSHLQNKYFSEKETTNIFEEKETYHYQLKTNIQYVIEQANVSRARAENFLTNFQKSLVDFLCKNFGPAETIDGYQGYRINILFDNESSRNQAKNFSNLVLKDISELIQNYFSNEHSNFADNINNYFDKLNMAQKLQKELPQKENKVTKFKI